MCVCASVCVCVCVCVCLLIRIYEGHSINKWNFASGVALFQGNQLRLVLSYSSKLSTSPFMIAVSRIFFFYRRLSVFPLYGMSFWFKLVVKKTCLTHL